MPTILDLLTDTLFGRLAVAGFEVPRDMTQKQKQTFVLAAVEDAVILQAHEYERLVEAARQVVGRWENGDLADAVRQLDMALEESIKRDSHHSYDEPDPSASPS
jgi:hypothetical protein